MNNYQKLLTKVDQFTSSLQEKRPGSFACKKGCSHCCVDGITLSRVEFDRIAEHLRSDATGIKERLEKQKPQPGKCKFLLEDGSCSIYSARPVVCRLWGSPLLFKNEDGSLNRTGEFVHSTGREGKTLTSCSLNFKSEPALDELPTSDIVNVETVMLQLSAINHVYCKEHSLDPEERISIASALSLL